jgi:uncharacterized protein (DUF488 family)
MSGQITQFASIGHSNRSTEEFTQMLNAARIELLVDVRAFPMSRSNPAFNIDRLPDELTPAGIEYRHLRALGGRRPKQPGVDESINAMWRVQSFHNYADYALGEQFAGAFAELVELGRERRAAIMCSEAVWWRCHRRIIVDYLLAGGYAVDHLMGPGQTVHATMTLGAKTTMQRKVLYPAG